MPKLDEYLRITEVAEYVGVAPNTLRNWGNSGKLTERRHPIARFDRHSPHFSTAIHSVLETSR